MIFKTSFWRKAMSSSSTNISDINHIEAGEEITGKINKLDNPMKNNRKHNNNQDAVLTNSRLIAWMVWIIASIFYSYQYVLRVMPNIMMQDILQQFNIDAATFGQFSGVYYLGYSLMHLPIGIALDRFGPKKVMPFCILLTSVGLLPILFTDFWVYPILGRALIGIGSSAAILGIFKIIRLTFSEEKFTRMLSFSVTIGLIGAIYGGGPVNYLSAHLGYKTVVAIFACVGLGLALITYWIVPNLKSNESISILSDIKEVFSSKKVLAICFLSGLMVGPLEGFADVWGAEFLKQTYGYDKTLAASLTSAIFLGMCFGAPIISFIAEKTRSYLGTIMGAGLVMALCFIILLFGKIEATGLSVMFVIVGVCSAYQIIAIYKASTYVHIRVAGLTTAVANMIIMIFGYFFHAVIGWLVNLLGGTDNPQAFIYGISVIPLGLAIGAIGFFILYLGDRKILTDRH